MEQSFLLAFLAVAALITILVRWARQRAEAPPRESRSDRLCWVQQKPFAQPLKQ
jgi:hypothetical protein